MKTKHTILLFALFCLMTANITAQKFNSAVQYLDYMGKEFKKISADTWDYTSSFSHGKKARTIENKRKELVKQLEGSIAKIEKMPDFDGNTEFRDSAVSYLKLNLIVLNQDYAKIVDMEEIAEQSYDAMEAYLLAREKANDKIDAASQMLNIEQKKFALAHGINITEEKDDIAKKLEAASAVYKYYNEVYLIFFKSYKQELYLLDAMNKMDFNAMEQNKNALAKFSVEGQQKIATIKPYKGDATIKAACMELLKFYESESTKKYEDISSYYIEKENFEKIKASFESKREAQRTKQDVDQYNKAVNDFNLATAKFNKTNTELNNNRSRLLDKWNNSTQAFTHKHVPANK